MNVKRVLVFSVFFSLVWNLSFTSQPNKITLDLIYRDWAFYPQSVRGIRSMNDGEHYTVLEGRKNIVKYQYQTGDVVSSLFNSDNVSDFNFPIEEYELSNDENKILLQTQTEQIYRHSFRASFYVYDMSSQEIIPLSKKGKQQLATFSPDGKKVAFVRDNNLFYVDLESNTEIQITSDGVQNEIINGAPDWVYEEEFGFSKGFDWSPQGDKLAFYRFDERNVKQFNMTLYENLYPEWYQFKYPKAGEENSKVDIYIYNLSTKKTIKANTGEEEDVYFPRIKWTANNEVLSIVKLNRLQNHVQVFLTEAGTGNSSLVYEEKDEQYISEISDDFLTFTKDGKAFIVISERNGFSHFYCYNIKGDLLNPITTGNFDIIDLIGVDSENNTLYYRSHEQSPLQTDVFSIQLDGTKKKRISKEDGSNTAYFSNTYNFYINRYSNANTPPKYTLYNKKGKQLRVLVDNAPLKNRMEEYGFSKKEFFTVPTNHDFDLNAYMIKPLDFDETKKYPVLMYVYGGPESQSVEDTYGGVRDAWFQLLTQHGYIVVCVDNRGTDGRGEVFKKATYMQLGKYETEDQITAAKYLGELDYIDAKRIGIFGWSYGGYMSLLCLTKGATYFKMGIAVAPVTNWRYYDTIYTERFMRTPQENPKGYDENSPINHVDKLQGKLLLVHGMGDDNVHFQNSVEISEKLVQANKQFEMQFYPNKNHGIYGGNTTSHLYTRMTNYILENL